MAAVRLAALTCAAVSIVSVASAWTEPRPELEPTDARQFTLGALDAAGLQQIRVAPVVRPGVVDTDAGERILVWITESSVRGGTIELSVDRSSAQAVRVTPRPDSVLSDRAFRSLDRYSRDPLHRDWVERNAAATAAGVTAVGAATAIILVDRRRRRWLSTR